MKMKQLIMVLALIAAPVFVWAGSGKVSFQDLDSNRDGLISVDESKKSSEISKKFSQADANKDGKLDAAEFAALETMPKESTPKDVR
jgi:Ca2+-binding EF-hand superfamily protein